MNLKKIIEKKREFIDVVNSSFFFFLKIKIKINRDATSNIDVK